MGGDCAGVDFSCGSIQYRKDPKVFKNGPFLIGYTSSFRMGQLLQYSFKPEPFSAKKDIDIYMRTAFIDGIRSCFEKGGFLRKDSEVQSGGIFLVGFKQRLFFIGQDFQVGEVHHSYNAIGCGRDVALGSLFATDYSMQVDGHTRVERALEAAERFNCGVHKPFTILNL
jgi:hypothetical protein